MILGLLNKIDQAQRFLTIVFFFLTIVIVGFQVLNRLVFQWPIMWTADVSVFCFIWLAMLSASCAVRSSGHFRVLAFIESLAALRRRRRELEGLSLLLMATLSGVLTYYGIIFAYAGLNEQSPGLGFSMIWSYSAIPVCCATALLFSIEKLAMLRSEPNSSSNEASELKGEC